MTPPPGLPASESPNSSPLPTSEQPPDRAQLQHEAQIIRDLVVPSALHTVLNISQFTSPLGTKEFLDQRLRDCGQPTDPLETMLIEQCVLAHHRITSLHMQASLAKSFEEVKVYNGAACQLQAEFRRTTLALKTYREPTPSRHVTVVKQQNLAQNQQVAFVDGQGGAALPVSQTAQNRPDTELGSNGRLDHVPIQPLAFQPETCRSRQEELVPATGPDPRRSGTTAPSRLGESAVEGFHRPTNGSREGSSGGEREAPAEGPQVGAGAQNGVS